MNQFLVEYPDHHAYQSSRNKLNSRFLSIYLMKLRPDRMTTSSSSSSSLVLLLSVTLLTWTSADIYISEISSLSNRNLMLDANGTFRQGADVPWTVRFLTIWSCSAITVIIIISLFPYIYILYFQLFLSKPSRSDIPSGSPSLSMTLIGLRLHPPTDSRRAIKRLSCHFIWDVLSISWKGNWIPLHSLSGRDSSISPSLPHHSHLSQFLSCY